MVPSLLFQILEAEANLVKNGTAVGFGKTR